MSDVKRNSLLRSIVCRGVKTLPFINKPPLLVTHLFFRILLTLPPPNFPAIQLFSNGIQIHYNNLYQTLL